MDFVDRHPDVKINRFNITSQHHFIHFVEKCIAVAFYASKTGAGRMLSDCTLLCSFTRLHSCVKEIAQCRDKWGTGA